MAAVYKILGFVFLGLATLGVLLPGLPTAPFLLVAAGCFSRGSERWHRWLRENRTFGPFIRDWEERRCIKRRSKIVAITLVLILGGHSIFFAIDNLWLKLAVAAILAYAICFVARIAVCGAPASRTPEIEA